MSAALSSALRTLTAALLALAACERGPAPGQASVDLRHARLPGGTPVARWQGDAVTAEEVARRLQEMSPAQRERYQTLEAKREYVGAVVRYELLVREAVAQGLQDEPEVVEAMKRALVARLVRAKQDEATASVTEAEVAAWYASHREDYVRPEEVRLTDLFLTAPRGDAGKEAEARARLETLRAQAQALPARDFAAFGRLARAHSEEPRTRVLDGDLRYQSYETLAREWGPEVAEAARALAAQGPGTLSGGVRTDAGLHLLQLTGHQEARDVSLQEAREQIAGRLAEEKRGRAWANFLSSLEKRAGLTLDAEALARVPVDVEAPAVPTTGPLPGLIPSPFPSSFPETPGTSP